jgi:beta-glucosidase
MSTLEEWLADPKGYALLVKEVGTDETGRPKGIAGDEEMIRIIGNFPLTRLAAFPNLGISPETVHSLVDHVSAADRR